MRHPILAGFTVSCIGLICAITLMLPALKAVGIIESSWMLVLLPLIILSSLIALGFLGIFVLAGGVTMLAFLGGFLRGLDRSKKRKAEESSGHDRSNLN